MRQTLGRNMDCYTERTKKRKKEEKKKKIFYKQTHILKQTLLLQTNKAGGWQAMGNGRTEWGASILITVKKKKVTHTHTRTHYTFFEHEFIFFSTVTLLRGARMKPGKEHCNTMFHFESCFVLTCCKICWFYITFFLILSGFEPAFLYIILCFGVFLASRVLLWLIGANIWIQNAQKNKLKSSSDSYFGPIRCWLALASLEMAASFIGCETVPEELLLIFFGTWLSNNL